MASKTENLTAAQLEARKENARKSTGPRTVEGKRRSSQNGRKHGLYSNANFFWDAAIALGEDPRDFERLLKGLVLARRPVDTLEMVLVEDIALLVWKKARLDGAEAAVQVCNLQKHDLERRKQFIQVGRAISGDPESEVREKGLRRTLDAPGKFEQVLSTLELLVEMLEKNDFSSNMQESLRAVYGTDPTLRGAALHTYYSKLSKMKPGGQEFEDIKSLMTAGLAEEIADAGREYELFLNEHVENTRAARMAATAPSHAQWAAIIRQQNALHRQLEHKIRLLEEIQEKRKREEERFLDNYEASLRRNPSDAPGGGRQSSNRKKILNRGNEPKTLLKTTELADTAPSKQTPFSPGKSAIKAKKRGVSMQETAGTGNSPAAGGQSPERSDGTDLICRASVRSRGNSRRAKEQICATRSRRNGLGCVIVSRLVKKPGVGIQEPRARSQDSGFRIQDSGFRAQEPRAADMGNGRAGKRVLENGSSLGMSFAEKSEARSLESGEE